MTLRQTRRVLWLSAVLGTAAAIGVATAAILLPLDEVSSTRSSRHSGLTSSATDGRGGDTGGSGVDGVDLVALRPRLERDLQGPLWDPPPVPEPPPPVPPPPPPLRLRLLGTVVEPGRSRAIFMTGSNEIVFAGVGQTLENAEVEAIERDGVRVHYLEESRTLTVEER